MRPSQVCLESCLRSLQGKLPLNLVEIERQRAAVRSFCIPGELGEEALEGRSGNPSARIVKSVDVDDVARVAETNGKFAPRGCGEVYE